MSITIPAFGLMSGMMTTLGILPHLLSLSFITLSTIGSKILSNWLFWACCSRRLDMEENLKTWRTVLNRSLFFHPNVVTSLLMIIADTIVDISLICVVLKISNSPIETLFIFFGCQALFSPIQCCVSDCFSQKNSFFFAATIILLTWIAVIELPTASKVLVSSFLLNFTKISSLSLSTQMLIILCGKSLLGNLTAIARAVIAEVVKMLTIKKLNEESIPQ